MLHMFTLRTILKKPRTEGFGVRLAVALLAVLALATGCKTSAHSTDSRVRKIDEMLDVELPKGTNMAKVDFFLSARGFQIENSGEAQTIVAIVRQVDTETLRPQNARVIFHFDPSGQLISYELAEAPDEPLHP